MSNPFRGSALANVAAVLALVVALGGTSYAATKIGTSDLKKNAVTSSKIDNKTIRSKDVRNGTLRNRDVRNNTLVGTKIKDGSLGPEDVGDMVLVPLPLVNGWTAWDPERGAKYGIDASGVVHLVGGIKQTGAYQGFLGTLPPGFRPEGGAAWVVTNLYGGSGPARINIHENGNMFIDLGPGATESSAMLFTSLDISFVP